ncbi:MAG TPA: aminotransferase class V-fold PLP-dependent enzyme, partial [Bryobacteraceae bacterium]|nr:aminotransferase class V-fold PLP-dependent enzyme [Bryobacteraceae bacterium]
MNAQGDYGVYLDCAASTPLDPGVREVFIKHLEQYGNAGSRTHDFGRRARSTTEHARQQVGAVAAASRSEVIFTSGATESDNLAILGLESHARQTGKHHIVTTSIEHSAVLGPVGKLERSGFHVTRVDPQPSGQVPAAAIEEALRPDTLLVSVMHVN